ncbi:MAG: hypothetical protein WCG20_00045 [bacterium]
MKKLGLILLLCTISIATTYAQNVRAIYLSKKDASGKYAALQKLGSISAQEKFAAEKITFEAGKNPTIQKQIWKYEALCPNMKKKLEEVFPGIGAWYEQTAAEKHISLFSFTTDIGKGITIDEIEMNVKAVPPTNVLGQIYYYTVKIQGELFYSENVRIQDHYEHIMRLYNSLNTWDQDSLKAQGYMALWQEQVNCYYHKQDMRTCTCGGKKQTISEFPNCTATKELILHPESVEAAPATKVLVALNAGNTDIFKEANAQRLNVWGNVNADIVKELCFLQLATLGEAPMNIQMKINLLDLWDAGEKFQSNGYLKDLGLTKGTIANLESYYSCVLGLTKVVARPKSVAPQSVIPTEKLQSSDTVVVQPKPRYGKKVSYTAYSLEKAVSRNLEVELSNRKELRGTCLSARAINDTTYEVLLNGCDTTQQLFPVGEFEIPTIANFFYYCSNVVSEELSDISAQMPMRFSIIVTGTADVLPYAKNEDLALNRATYISTRLGDKALATAQEVTTVAKTGLPVGKRYVSLTFVLRTKKTT